MKNRAERICSVCKAKYLYCNCQEYQHMERWHDAYCTENCKNLYNITAGWINGWLDKEVELSRLSKSDLSRIDQFPQWMQDTIKEMQSYKPEVELDVIDKVLSEDVGKDNKDDIKENHDVIDEKKSVKKLNYKKK